MLDLEDLKKLKIRSFMSDSNVSNKSTVAILND